MSMKCMKGPYHYIIATFELKTETTSSAEAATCRVMVWHGAAPLWPPTTYKACQTLAIICIKWIWYEYEKKLPFNVIMDLCLISKTPRRHP